MLRTHAQADARSDFIAGKRRRDEILPRELRMRFRHRNERRQCHGADMQNALAVHVVELETLHLRAVDQSRMCRRQFPIGAPDRRVLRFVALLEGLPQDAAPLQLRAINRAAKRVQNEELESPANRGGNLVVA